MLAIWLWRLAVCAASAAAPVGAARSVASEVALQLVLAVDGSYSVDDREFDLQTRGIAAAFRHPAVIGAIEATAPPGIAVTLLQWSGARTQTQAVGWTGIGDAAAAERFAAAVEAAGRAVPRGSTAIGDALTAALALIESGGYSARRRVIDLSGDGTNNQGEWPVFVRPRVFAADVTINGLAIVNEEARLDDYFRDSIAGGPGAFVLRADDYDDFARAMLEKILREVIGDPVAATPAARRLTSAENAATPLRAPDR